MNGLPESPGFNNGPSRADNNLMPRSLSRKLATKASAPITDISSASTDVCCVNSAIPHDTLRSSPEGLYVRSDHSLSAPDTDEANEICNDGDQLLSTQVADANFAYCDFAPLFPWEQSVKMSRKEVEVLTTKIRNARGKSVSLATTSYFPSDRLPEIAAVALAQEYRKLGAKERSVVVSQTSKLESWENQNSSKKVSIDLKKKFKLNKDGDKNRIVLCKVTNDATGQESFVFKKLN
jgi:hypothetical protein